MTPTLVGGYGGYMCMFPKVVKYIYKDDGKKDLIWLTNYKGHYDGEVTLPCRKCYICLKLRAERWATRLELESKYYDEKCFVTLTYEDEYLPDDSQLNVRDVQLFIKRLRKFLKTVKIKYFCSGEYGDLKSRPHYHLIIFGYVPKDMQLFFGDTFISKNLQKIWGNGYVTIKQFSRANARYCVKYITAKQALLLASAQKNISLPKKEVFKQKQVFCCSNGIGQRYYNDNVEHIKINNCIYINGKRYQPGDYFERNYYTDDVLAEIKRDRILMFDMHKEENYKRMQNQLKLFFEKHLT
ncbi:MAG: replication initiator protein [Microvirus sp.]|nr:MAG: replication initiator protein [Microvirus sp.]